MIRASLRIRVTAFLVAPFMILLLKIKTVAFPEMNELSRSFVFTVEQAFLSGFFSLVAGVAGARGLLAMERGRRPAELILLLPNLLPSLFVILACLKTISPFPFGLTGIVLIHTFMNSGLASVTIAHLFETKVGGWSELALVEGASKRKFVWIVLKYLKKDLGLVFMFIFGICFSSLTVPLIAGRFDAFTTERLIYEKIRVSGDFSQAVGLSILQSAFIFFLTLVLSRESHSPSSSFRNLSRLSSRFGLVVPLAMSCTILGAQFEGLSAGLSQLTSNLDLQNAILSAITGTLTVGIGTGALTFALLSAVIFATPHRNFQRFLNGYAAPSSVLTGFSLILLDLPVSPLLKMTLGISLVQLPLFYRLYVDARLDELETQITVARTLGANWTAIFSEILVPQIFQTIGLASGLSGLWACGEFALSSLLTGQDLTLALLVKSSMTAYRLEVATILVWLTFGCGTMIFLLFWGLGYGFSRKSNS